MADMFTGFAQPSKVFAVAQGDMVMRVPYACQRSLDDLVICK
jgi:hypothetical protein